MTRHRNPGSTVRGAKPSSGGMSEAEAARRRRAGIPAPRARNQPGTREVRNGLPEFRRYAYHGTDREEDRGMEQLRIVGHGGGVQTTALLVLAGQRKLTRYRRFVFANVGDDSEDPAALAYLREIAMPYAAAHGLTIYEVPRVKGDGSTETIYGQLTEKGSRSVPIPVRGGKTGAPGRRACTRIFKIRVVRQWVKSHGATPASPAEIAMGISAEEISRVNSRRAEPYERLAYPLVGLLGGEKHDFGLGRPVRRADCERIIRAERLPGGPRGPLAVRLRDVAAMRNPATGDYLLAAVTRADLRRSGYSRMPLPGKSACWFCPLHTLAAWRQQRRETPGLFARSCELEEQLNTRLEGFGRGRMYLSRYGKPLAEAIPAGPPALFGGGIESGDCDNGWCGL